MDAGGGSRASQKLVLDFCSSKRQTKNLLATMRFLLVSVATQAVGWGFGGYFVCLFLRLYGGFFLLVSQVQCLLGGIAATGTCMPGFCLYSKCNRRDGLC